jgi:hypothetical protein
MPTIVDKRLSHLFFEIAKSVHETIIEHELERRHHAKSSPRALAHAFGRDRVQFACLRVFERHILIAQFDAPVILYTL